MDKHRGYLRGNGAALDLAAAITGVIRRCKTSTFSTTPPNANAAITCWIVSNLLDRPPAS